MSELDLLRSGELKDATRFTLSDSLTEFPRELFALEHTLEYLDLSNNRLTDLPADFGRFKKLKTVFLSGNLFEELPSVLGECESLQIIGCRSCRLKRLGENSIPPSVHWLTLTNNCIEALPDWIGNCTRLRKVGLSGNRIHTLPEAMKNCRDLELLRISANALEELPGWLMELPNLHWLAFSGNPCTHRPEPKDHLCEIHWESLELLEQLGQGASGVISKGICREFGEPAAVKVFKGAVTSDGSPEDETAACIEAGAHPHLVSAKAKIVGHPENKTALLFDLIPDHFAVLGNPPTLDSCTIDQYPEERNLTRNQADRIIEGISSAVEHLHRKGILHGDLYAHNIFFNDHGHAVLGDFGAASFFNTESGSADLLKEIDRRALRRLRLELNELVR